MKIKQNIKTDKSAQIVELLCKTAGVKEIIWVSDLHGDSKHSNFKFLESVIRKYPNALLVIGGDHLDVMQNFRDPRGSKSSTEEQFNKDTYINEIIDYNVKLWGKYANRILAFFIGNHELTQIKYYGIDITREIVKELNLRHNANIILGDLAGWLKLRFEYQGRHFTKNIYFAHKPITGGKRSKGMLSVDLVKGEYPDADIYISEHIHNSWIKPERVEKLTDKGKVKYINKWVLQMPTLKDEFKGEKRGYTHNRSYGSTPIGLVVLRFLMDRNTVTVDTPHYELVV